MLIWLPCKTEKRWANYESLQSYRPDVHVNVWAVDSLINFWFSLFSPHFLILQVNNSVEWCFHVSLFNAKITLNSETRLTSNCQYDLASSVVSDDKHVCMLPVSEHSICLLSDQGHFCPVAAFSVLPSTQAAESCFPWSSHYENINQRFTSKAIIITFSQSQHNESHQLDRTWVSKKGLKKTGINHDELFITLRGKAVYRSFKNIFMRPLDLSRFEKWMFGASGWRSGSVFWLAYVNEVYESNKIRGLMSLT